MTTTFPFGADTSYSYCWKIHPLAVVMRCTSSVASNAQLLTKSTPISGAGRTISGSSLCVS